MTRSTSYLPLPSPSPGTTRSLMVLRYGDVEARPKVYIQTSLHADEWPGLLVVHHLRRMLDDAERERRIKGQVVVVPVANPIGLGQHLNGRLNGRFAFDGSGNFNRNFPDLTDAVLARIDDQLSTDTTANVSVIRDALTKSIGDQPRATEVDSLKTVLLGLSLDADMVFDLHCDGDALLHLYAARAHQRMAGELGAQLGARAVLVEQDPGGAPFDAANAGPWIQLRDRTRLGAHIPPACFSTTVELRGEAAVGDELAKLDAQNLVSFLQRHSVLEGDPGLLPDALCEPTPLEATAILEAPACGVLAYRKQLGDHVTRGETVAELVDVFAEDAAASRVAVKSQTDGVLFAKDVAKLVRPGQAFAKIAGREPLPERIPGRLLQP